MNNKLWTNDGNSFYSDLAMQICKEFNNILTPFFEKYVREGGVNPRALSHLLIHELTIRELESVLDLRFRKKDTQLVNKGEGI